jgi:galactokinase
MEELPMRRAGHVITENERVLQAVKAMEHNDAVRLGQLLHASHVSLRDDFDVSSQELNAMVECARNIPGCYGARMTGAGFGGCAIALIQAEVADTFLDTVSSCYTEHTGKSPKIYLCTATNGAEILPCMKTNSPGETYGL